MLRASIKTRAGVASFGGMVQLSQSVLDCNAIQLDSEQSGSFTDAGANVCGCASALEPCRAVSSSLSPPEPLPD